jgi:superfamily II DNA or RNA helicase
MSGYLCDALVKRVELRELDLSQVKQTKRAFDRAELSEAMNTQSHNEEIVRRWIEHAVRDDGEQMLTGIFAVDTAHADALTAEVNRQMGYNACVSIHSKVPDPHERLADLMANKYVACSSVAMVAEGFDHPPLQCGVLARPTKSDRLLVQMLGRFLRPHHSKNHALLLDFSGGYESLDLTTIYDVIAPAETERRTISERSADFCEEFDELPLLSDVISAVRDVSLFRKVINAAKGGVPWVAVDHATDVVKVGPCRFLIVAQNKGNTELCTVCEAWTSGSTSMWRYVVEACPEEVAFVEASALIVKRKLSPTSDDAYADFKKWKKNYSAPSEKMKRALIALGIDPPIQHGEAVKTMRRAKAAGR